MLKTSAASRSRVLDHAEKWEALGEERQMRITQMASELKRSSPVLQDSFKYRLKRHRAVFVGSHAVDWLVHVKNFVNRTVACDALQLMLVGNLIREVGDRPVYKDSKKALYRFISDDDPKHGPSLASVAPQALAQGWLDLKVASTKLCKKPFQSGKRRYCALKQHGVPYVLFYYISDGSSQPNGFIKFDNPKTQLTVRHHRCKKSRLALKLVVTSMDGATLDLVASADEPVQLEHWIRSFVGIGAQYLEDISESIAANKDIYSFSELTSAGEPLSLEAYRGKVLLIVNTSSNCAQTALNYTQLQHLHEEFGPHGFEIVAFPCTQFDANDAQFGSRFIENISQYGVKFKMMRNSNVNGCGSGMNVSAVWEYLKSATASNRGTYVPWNFTKFLVDRNGRPAGRYDVDEDPFSMRDDIFARLTSVSYGPGATNLNSVDDPAAPMLKLGSDPFRLPTRTVASLTTGSSPVSATAGNTTQTTVALVGLVESSPRDPTAAIAGLGKYYILNGKEPFERGPVVTPTKTRTGESRFRKAIEHFKRKRACVDNTSLPTISYTPISPRPEICGPVLVTYSGMDFEQGGLSFDLGYENDRSCCGHLDDRLHQRRKDFAMSYHGLSDAAGLSSWGQILTAAADPDVEWDLLGPIDVSPDAVLPTHSPAPVLEVSAQGSPVATVNAPPPVPSLPLAVMTPPWSPSGGPRGSTTGAPVKVRSSIRQSQELRKNAAQRLAVLQSPGLKHTAM